MGRAVGKRTRRFNLNLTDTEYNDLLSEARKSGLTPQDFARSSLAGKPSPAVNRNETEVQRKDGLRLEKGPTKEDIDHQKRLLEMEFESKEKELEVLKKVAEFQDLERELKLMELEDQKQELKKELAMRKTVRNITKSLSK